jgi:hypothetical protein
VGCSVNLRKNRTIDALKGNPVQSLYPPRIARLSMNMGYDWRKLAETGPSLKMKWFLLWDSAYSMCNRSVKLCMEVACVGIRSIRIPTTIFKRGDVLNTKNF